MSVVAKELLENKEDLEKEIKELFQKIDLDGSNEIDKKEFREFMKKLYAKSGKKISNELIDKFIKNLDKDKSGTINLEEFRDYAIKILETLSQQK